MGKIETLNFNETVEYLWTKLKTAAIMQLAASVDDHVTVRSVSCIMYDGLIHFKTDKNFEKTKQLLKSKTVGMCKYNINVEGTAQNLGLVVDEPEQRFAKMYTEHLDGSYNAYSHEDTEILIAVTPNRVEIWDCDEDNYAFQIMIDFVNKTATKEWYDEH